MPHRLVLIAAAALVTAVTPAAAQTLAVAAPSGDRPNPAPRADGLRDEYRVQLYSMWPQYAAAGCVNGGDEELAGTLVRQEDGSFVGRLTRRSTIRFCGVHAAAAKGCALTMSGRGPVAAVAAVDPVGGTRGRPLLRLMWTAAENATTTDVSGDCPDGFGTALEGMYRTTVHGVEFTVPDAEGHLTIPVLEEGWVVELD